ncbi:DUF4240 domain-containing protein [Rhizobiales bacterium RZME27]|uniref:DUF4240 domain-containing protein n=1 Tax=Endobacterium cereale TaxID=2663029 RepID=A0A6A8AEH5_9HYPH|nr:DUF4240 domain-containing protein [Endobacterium cereale]MEB2846966.1 DUF4240 domain-containing protein [Endobacterium cereale]MQY47616.1 DUF4240 domain-containing protein [Endobacterium cereale]
MRRSFISGILGLLGLSKAAAGQSPASGPSSAIMSLAPVRRLADAEARDWFWQIVDASSDKDEEAQIARFRGTLDKLSDQDLVDFISLYWAVDRELYTMRLWAAAYLINGGASDDGFTDFRAWLIARGRLITERALADPDSLAELGVESDSATFELFGYVMYGAFKARSGDANPAFRNDAVAREAEAPDWKFDFDDEAQMRRRLPKLSALYL